MNKNKSRNNKIIIIIIVESYLLTAKGTPSTKAVNCCPQPVGGPGGGKGNDVVR